MDRLEGEIENLWEASDRMTDEGKAEWAAPNLLGAQEYLRFRPRPDARSDERLERLVGILDPDRHGRWRAKALLTLSARVINKDLNRAEAMGTEALDLAEVSGDLELACLARLTLGRILGMADKYDEAVPVMDRGYETAVREGFGRLEAMLLSMRANVRSWGGAPMDEVIRDLKAAEALFREQGNRFLTAENLNFLGMFLTETGDLEDALTAFQASIEIDREIGKVSDMTLANLGFVRGLMGDLKGAMACYAEAEEMARASGHKYGLLRCWWSRALEQVRHDREESIRCFHEAEAVAEEIGTLKHLAALRELRAKTMWLSGKASEALGVLDEAENVFPVTQLRGLDEHTNRCALRAILLADLGRFEEVIELTTETLKKIGEFSEKVGYLIELHFASRALAFAGLGDPGEAKKCAGTAREFNRTRIQRNPEHPWFPVEIRWMEDLVTEKALAALKDL
jgi:tetratricopeptide (TPR) repeat protein